MILMSGAYDTYELCIRYLNYELCVIYMGCVSYLWPVYAVYMACVCCIYGLCMLFIIICDVNGKSVSETATYDSSKLIATVDKLYPSATHESQCPLIGCEEVHGYIMTCCCAMKEPMR